MPEPTYSITGVPFVSTPGGPIPLRVEIDDFFNDEKFAVQRDLLYLALAKFQSMDYDNKLSYFQVAGVHGLPYVRWGQPGEYHAQYCAHGTILFPTWHRPYMALFEQRLYEIMVNDIIPLYGGASPALKQQAEQFRLPYWDWALKKPRVDKDNKPILAYDLPLIVKQEFVQVSQPGSTIPVTIKNPFYRFQAKDKMGRYGITPLQYSDEGQPYAAVPFDSAATTSRQPGNIADDPNALTAFLSGEGSQNNGLAAEKITEGHWYAPGNETWSLKEAVHRLLTKDYFEKYEQFATVDEALAGKDPRFWLSLEGIHNNLHNWTGGSFGHMGWVPVAAFDPIFFLHHANVDRLFAVWQTLNEDKWFTKVEVTDPETGKVVTFTPDDPLEPFHLDTNGTVYTSNTARYHTSFGYSYPELQEWKFNGDAQAYRDSIKATIEKNYGPDAATQLSLAHHDVIINVAFKKFALGGVPFTVKTILEGAVVGKVENFSFVPDKLDNGDSTCPNCAGQEDANLVVTGQVFLTHSLVKAVRTEGKALSDLDIDSITAYLKEHLSWEVVTRDGHVVPLDRIPSLKVTPIVGRRNVSLVEKPKTSPNERSSGAHKVTVTPLEGGILDLPKLDPINLPYVSAKWAEDGTIQIGDEKSTRAGDGVYTIQVGDWSSYKPLFRD